MGSPIVIYGKSGAGKSRSLKNFEDSQIQIFNVLKKALPFRNKFSHIHNDNQYNVIFAKMKTAADYGIKVIVIDDCGYLMAGKYLDQCENSNNKGNAVFQFYSSIAHEFWQFVQYIKEELPDDVLVYLMMHEDKGEDGEVRVGCIGKQLAEKTKIWEWVTIALRAMSVNGQHYFCTVTDGMDITKAPEEMFAAEQIENDLVQVDATIRDYWGFKPLTTAKKETKKEA